VGGIPGSDLQIDDCQVDMSSAHMTRSSQSKEKSCEEGNRKSSTTITRHATSMRWHWYEEGADDD